MINEHRYFKSINYQRHSYDFVGTAQNTTFIIISNVDKIKRTN